MERSYLTTSQGIVSYLERKGQFPIVFLHGLGGSSNNWLSLSKYLSSKYRLIMPDLLGHGRSVKYLRNFTINEQVEMLRELMEEIGIKYFAMAGNSYGGWISMRFSLRVRKPSSLFLIDAAGVNPHGGPVH